MEKAGMKENCFPVALAAQRWVRRGPYCCRCSCVKDAGLTHLMSSLLFGVTALDPLTYTVVSALLLVVSVQASYLPARRAMAIDPAHALRGE